MTEQQTYENKQEKTEQAATETTPIHGLLQAYGGMAHSIVGTGLTVAQVHVANAGQILKSLAPTIGVKVAEVSLNGASDVLDEVSKSIARLRNTLSGNEAEQEPKA